jgi:hypothetical protein
MKIAFVSQPEYFRFIYENELDTFAEVSEFKYELGKKKSDYQDLIDFEADYNFIFRAETIPSELIAELKGIRVALSSEIFPKFIGNKPVITIDSLTRYLAFRAIRKKSFDYVYHYDESSIPFMKWDGLHVSGPFPFPVATSVYTPEQRKKHWDIFFIGRSTRYREMFLGPLKHKYNFLHICHGFWGKPLVEHITRSSISLNIHAEDEISWEPRMQMMMACGAFMISQKISPNKFLRSGVDYIEISNPRQLFEAVAYYLNHPSERDKIAKSGQERVRSMLDSNAVFRKLIEEIEGRKHHQYRYDQGSYLLDLLAQLVAIYRKVRTFKH